MKKKNPAVESAAAAAPIKKSKSEGGSIRDMHSTFFLIALVLAGVALVFVLLAKNGINGNGYVSFQPVSDKPPINITFLTSGLCSWVAGILAVVSIGFGVFRNYLKKQNSLMAYLIGIAALVLSVMALLAVQYP